MNSPEIPSDHPPTEKAWIVVQRGDARLNIVELLEGGRVTIGRAQSNHVVVPDVKCSRHHCELYYRQGVWHLRDLDSRNGVTVDGERVEGERAMRIGQSIRIGACSLLLTSTLPEVSNRSTDVSAQRLTDAPFEIIERKSGTQYDSPSSVPTIEKVHDDATDLFRIARAMSLTSTEEDLCRVVLDGLRVRTGATLGGILLAPDDSSHLIESLEPRAVLGNRPASEFSSFLTRVACDDQDAILAHDISGHAALSARESLQDLEAESAICAPVRHAEVVLGVIHLYSVDASQPLQQSDLEFVLAVADQMGDQLYALRERKQLEAGLDRVRRHVSDLQDQLQAETELVGYSPRLEDVRRAIARVAPTDALVLIRGESGVGKELVARAVHFNSQRKDGPFVCVNCAALTESLLESELFGHEKGAFTGASTRRAGKFEQANGGTLFLDEIGEMSPEIQAKFLRVLEGQAFERVGGGDPISVDVRVVTATNQDLEEAVRTKRLRRDLFFRLQVIEITVPPLREHPEDIPSIAQHFVQRFAAQSHRRVRRFNSAALQKLQSHDWPGNVRELRNVVERAVILSDHEILGPEDVVLTKLVLDDQHAGKAPPPAMDDRSSLETSVDPHVDLWGSFIQQELSLDEIDRLYIEAVLRATNWNKSKASRILQIERTTLDRRLKKYGISRPGNGSEDEDPS